MSLADAELYKQLCSGCLDKLCVGGDALLFYYTNMYPVWLEYLYYTKLQS
jgi:hypothetical protein